MALSDSVSTGGRPVNDTASRHLARLATTGGSQRDVLPALLAAARERLPSADVAVGPASSCGSGDISVQLPFDVRPDRHLIAHVPLPGAPGQVQDELELLVALAAAGLALRQARGDARRDGLTGLLNRAALSERLGEEITRTQRQDSPLACAIMDLDDFKRLNDTQGHLAGDALLQRVGEHLEAVTRPFDAVARFGGDEFVVLMPGIGREHTEDAAGRLLWALGEALGGHAGQIGASIGVAMFEAGMDAVGLLDAADNALREAKDAGGGSWVVAGAQAGPAGTPNGDLQLALSGEATVLFQPVVDLATNGLVGVEALSRGPGSLLRPEALLDQARALGRLVALDEELHRQAFRAADTMGLRSPLSLFVNIEPETLARVVGSDRFWQRTARTFAALSEVTERAVLQRPGALLRGCRRLRELGWGIALDDVGVESRALALLPLVAPDVIKLDRSIIQSEAGPHAIRALLACGAQAQSGGARILAEGIETEEHRLMGLALGAQLGQGYLFGPPSAEVPGFESAAPIPRTLSPRAVRGMTPFHLLTAEHPAHQASGSMLQHLQDELLRRGAVVGPTALVVCGHGFPVPESTADGLTEAGAHAGLVAWLTAATPRTVPVGIHHQQLDPSEPAAQEWTCALLTPNAAVAMAARARPKDPGRWLFAISHDRDLVVATAHELVSRLR